MRTQRIILATAAFACLAWTPKANAQMVVGTDTLYGNEWVRYDQNYFKIKLAADGLYRVGLQELTAVGVFAGQDFPKGEQFQLFRLGQQVPIFVSTDGPFGPDDYLEFFGQQNRGELDAFLYKDRSYQLNPLYSLFTDTAAYYLTWRQGGSNDRIRAGDNDLSNPPAREVSCLSANVSEYHDALFGGKYYAASYDVSAEYDLGEGYCAGANSTDQTINFAAPNFTPAGADALVQVRILCGAGSHYLALDFNGVNYLRDTFNNWAVKAYSFSVPASALLSSNSLRIVGSASADDKFRLVLASLTFPQTFDFGNKDYARFELPPTGQAQYLEITNFKHGGAAPVLYDLTNRLRIITRLENNVVKVLLPPSASTRTLVLVSVGAMKTTSEMAKVVFTDFTKVSGDYIILSHARLFDDGQGHNYVQDYADYRSSAQGGGYKAVVVDVGQVYEQFAYGTTRHEQGIRNFVHWAIKNWGSAYLFIVGKGVYYGIMRNNPVEWREFDFVPAYGYPSSDNLLAADHRSNIPKIPIGRIAAHTPDMVRQYLQKVKELEFAQQNTPQTIPDRAWMKNVLHLGGGDKDIQAFIRKKLNELKDTVATGTFGANVFSLFKNSNDVVQSATSADVIDFINKGVSLITFFGHSAPNTLDFNIGDPAQYQNNGRYPFIYAMGCNTNRLFESRQTLSEDYVFVEKRGAIAFIGSTATTSLGNLSTYGTVFYQKLAKELYGRTIGEIMQSVIRDYPFGGFWGELVQNNLMLHGDPALRINPHPAPDYLVNIEKTKISPAFIDVQADSFSFDLTITNIGRAIADSFNVLIRQEFPDGTISLVDTLLLPTPYFERAYQIQIPLSQKDILGENKLLVSIDYDNAIAEKPASAELNNSATIPFIVVSNSAFPVYPPEYSIVNKPDNFILKASTASAFAGKAKYHIEIDTAYTFDSPLNRDTTVESMGGLIQWKPNLAPSDSIVYFWRISLDSFETGGIGYDWRSSSFIYLSDNNEGWSQSRFWQFRFQETSRLKKDVSFNKLFFDVANKELKIKTGTFGNIQYLDAAFFDDGFKLFDGWPCDDFPLEQFFIVVYDKTSLKNPIIPILGDSPNCSPDPKPYYRTFFFNIKEREKIITILNQINQGSFVASFTTQNRNRNFNADQWGADSITLGTNLFQILEAQGATKVRDLATNQTPYIFIFQKDNPNWEGMREVHAANVNDIMQTTTILQGRQSTGSLTSTPIGPARAWGSLHWRMSEREAHDFVGIDVVGIDKNGRDTLLHTNVLTYDTTLAHIDALQYPYLKLRLNLTDSVNYTAPQLDYWRVLYQPYPELALDPSRRFAFHKDTLQEGDTLRLELGMHNISPSDMDSLLVRFTIKDQQNNELKTYNRFAPVAKGDSLTASFEAGTNGLAGHNLLTIEANPDEDQPEQSHFNNVGVLEFVVTRDQLNPLLDVTFDGEHILNGDLVSPTPEIRITLRDENRFLALDDTSHFDLRLQYPGSGDFRPVNLADPAVAFFPARGNNNKAEIHFKPQLPDDGNYRLRVQARDRSGNKSGAGSYEVAFQVINKSMISNVGNYPNPFSTTTRFVYTLTGNEQPAQFKIQILTASGRIVREISQAEFGPMKTGTHLSDFIWDGTDQYGDPLANGVYLYRVIARNAGGKDFEKYDTGTDAFFKNDYGKMVILR
jgi:hypothetical protein